MKPTKHTAPTNTKNYDGYAFMNLSLQDMEGEEWKDIIQFDGYYRISNYGRIWATPRPINSITGQSYYTRERIRKQGLSKYYNQYTNENTEQLTIKLRYENKEFSFKINRLVYEYFVGPLNNNDIALLVIHKDGDNCNNHFDNLVLMNHTQLYGHMLSLNHIPRTGHIHKRSAAYTSEKNSPRPIVKYSLDGRKLDEYESLHHAAVANNVYRSSLRTVAQHKLIQLHGFVYRFKDDPYHGEHAAFSSEKRITQYALDGKKIKVFTSVKKAAKFIGADPDTLSKCALGKSMTCCGFVWRYGEDNYAGEYKDKIKNKPLEVIQYSLKGAKIAHFASVSEASRLTGFSPSTLLDCASKKSKVAHGFVWRFPGDPYNGEHKLYRIGKPVCQYTLDGKLVDTYPTIEAGARGTGLTAANIQKNVQGKNKTAGGFVWKAANPQQAKKIALTVLQYSHNLDRNDSKEVVQYTIEGERLRDYISISEAARVMGIAITAISIVLNKPGRTAAGFVWRTRDEEYNGEIAQMHIANKSRIVTQYDMEGRKLHVFDSMRQAQTILGIDASLISRVARGKLKSTGGFIWYYGDGPEQIDINLHFASTEAYRNGIRKPVLKYSLSGNFLKEYPSIYVASREEGIPAALISSAINGQSKSAGGDVWKLKEDPEASTSLQLR